MLHLDYLKELPEKQRSSIIKKASGCYYTGESVGRRLAKSVAKQYHQSNPLAKSIRVLDPFGGDGRLLVWVLEAWIEFGFPDVQWNVELWDYDDAGFDSARTAIQSCNIGDSEIQYAFSKVDAFSIAIDYFQEFDILITNPPWELLKPDRRELKNLECNTKGIYINHLRTYDNWLGENYPLSQPKRKFAGWGTNLSRVGVEVGLRLTRKGGVFGAVVPSTLFADEQSERLRVELLANNSLTDLAYYSAECRLYETADTTSVTMTVRVGEPPSESVPLTKFDGEKPTEHAKINLDPKILSKINHVLPVSFGAPAMDILFEVSSKLPKWGDVESSEVNPLWAGREIDETGSSGWLKLGENGPLFLKGRMISRYTIGEQPAMRIVKENWISPKSARHSRIVWRDVSRPSQKRRMIATLIDPGWIAGNSLGVAHLGEGTDSILRALLGVMNSTIFEFQLRAFLASGHISLGSLRKVSIPDFTTLAKDKHIVMLVERSLSGDKHAEFEIDAYVAREHYGLGCRQYETVLQQFPKLSVEEIGVYVDCFEG